MTSSPSECSVNEVYSKIPEKCPMQRASYGSGPIVGTLKFVVYSVNLSSATTVRESHPASASPAIVPPVKNVSSRGWVRVGHCVFCCEHPFSPRPRTQASHQRACGTCVRVRGFLALVIRSSQFHQRAGVADRLLESVVVRMMTMIHRAELVRSPYPSMPHAAETPNNVRRLINGTFRFRASFCSVHQEVRKPLQRSTILPLRGLLAERLQR